jgi:excinuclease ABC subunit C
MTMINIKDFLKTLPTQPGVYQMLGEKGEVLYVGKARHLKKRIASYFSSKQKDIKTKALLSHIKDISVTVTATENEALLLECRLIKKYKPHYNVLFRDDKSYPYILITEERPYPCIKFYRGEKEPKGKYFGPYPNIIAVREAIHLVQKIFGLRVSNDHYSPNRTRPCLKYQIGLCSGSCAGLISEKEYRISVQNAILFLQGKKKRVLSQLNRQMQEASRALNYEMAAKIRDQIARFQMIQEQSDASVTHKPDYFIVLEPLLSTWGLNKPIKKIECFDISHSMGEATVGSCVVFNPEGAVKRDYRRFNIKNVTPGNDVAAIHQAVFRRYQRLQTELSPLPDLVLIDGGLGQLAAAQKALNELNIHEIILIGVAKGAGRKPGLETLHFINKPAINLPMDSPALLLIQRIRDEAHRFAITSHRKQRAKKRFTSSLEKIPGIGKKRRRELLTHFGGIQAINRASLKELCEVTGISESLAKQIFEALHTNGE